MLQGNIIWTDIWRLNRPVFGCKMLLAYLLFCSFLRRIIWADDHLVLGLQFWVVSSFFSCQILNCCEILGILCHKSKGFLKKKLSTFEKNTLKICQISIQVQVGNKKYIRMFNLFPFKNLAKLAYGLSTLHHKIEKSHWW
jgi:hypothetical protein